ncbi:MAG: hypothetical protein KDK11_13480 [Maritimibacter sp.]|nr:hypothetical protein [Maritimibacter sp.]
MCRCCHPNRRQVIALLATAPLLAACKPQTEGPEEIRWGRESCAICGMIISDPRFGAEVRGGPGRELLKFDDLGDALHWLSVQDWADAPETEIWVRDYETGTRWLAAREVRYLSGVVSPMDYGFGAVEQSGPDTLSFEEMRAEVMRIGLSSRCLPLTDIGD